MADERSTVLLTGASGLLGTWLRRCSPDGVRLVSVEHRRRVAGDGVTADLRDRRSVDAAMALVRPGLVIHAAYARDAASIVEATGHLADAAARAQASLVFVSSESVFSGDGLPRAETARPDPVWDYGRWKVAAEEVVQRTVADAAVVRLPLITSLTPHDHIVGDIRRGAAAGTPSVWYSDEFRQPAAADELARAIWMIAALPGDSRAGLWHLPGAERLSRFELATRAVAAIGLDRSWVLAAPTPAGAHRPRDLNLVGPRAERELGWRPSPVYR